MQRQIERYLRLLREEIREADPDTRRVRNANGHYRARRKALIQELRECA